jgi:uncharacterized protein
MAEVQAGEGVEARSEVTQDGDVVAATLEYLARALVAHPDDVVVERTTGERGPTYRLRVHGEDMGRVIGRSGRIARAIRQVVRASAIRAGTTAIVEITG